MRIINTKHLTAVLADDDFYDTMVMKITIIKIARMIKVRFGTVKVFFHETYHFLHIIFFQNFKCDIIDDIN